MKIFDYIKGDKRGRKAHDLELEAMRDPLLDDALEGFRSVEGDHGQALERMRARISMRTSPPRRSRWNAGSIISIAAGLLIVMAIGTLLILYSRSDYFIEPSMANGYRPIPEELLAQIEVIREPYTPAGPAQGSMLAAEFAEDEPIIRRPVQPVPPVILQDADTASDVSDMIVVSSARQRQAVSGSAAGLQKENASPKSEDAPKTELKTALQGRVAGTVDNSDNSENKTQNYIRGTSRVADESPNTPRGNTVKGKVVDSKGKPLAGVTVLVKGTSTGATTDRKGNFVIPGVVGNPELVASYLGFSNAHIVDYNSQEKLHVAMKEDSSIVDDVVVVGYGAQKEQKLTGSLPMAEESPAVPAPLTYSVEVRPEFQRYVKANLTPVYDNNGEKVTGTVLLQFSIDANGRPQRIKVIKGINRQADRQSKELLSSGPDWPLSSDTHTVAIEFE